MIQIPNKSYQLIILIGFLLFYLFYQKDQKNDKLIEDFDKISVLDVNPVSFKDSILAMDIQKKYELSIADAKEKIRHDRETRKFNGSLSNLELQKKYFKESDSLMNLYIKYGDKMYSSLQADKAVARKMKTITSRIESNNNMANTYLWGGIIITFSGLFLWTLDERERAKKLKNKIENKPNKYSIICQSCAKDFNSITLYGSNLDGSKNYHFCSNCYQNGRFINSSLAKSDIRRLFWNALFNKYNKTNKEYSENKKVKKSFDAALKDFDKKLSQVDRWNSIDY